MRIRFPLLVSLAAFMITTASFGSGFALFEAGAKAVAIRVGRAAGMVSVTVSDDGRGMGDGRKFGVGLRGMQERVHELHGTLQVDSSERGTTIAATMPSAETAATADLTEATAD